MSAARATVFVLPVYRRAWLWHARLDAAAGGNAASAGASASAPTAPIAAVPRPRWRDGATLEDKVELAGDQLAAWVSFVFWERVFSRFFFLNLVPSFQSTSLAGAAPARTSHSASTHTHKHTQTHAKLATQWSALAAAPEKSIKGRVYRAAQAILAREKPVAAFFRSLPAWAPASRTAHGVAGGGGPPILTLAHPPCLPTRLVRRRTRALVAAARPALARRAMGWSLAVLPLIPTLLTPVR